MNGPEHYREAERLLAIVSESADPEWITEWGAITAAAAQVHATLALAAATAAPTVAEWIDDEDTSGRGWTQVTS